MPTRPDDALAHAITLRTALDTLLTGYLEAKRDSISTKSPAWAAMKGATSSLETLLEDRPHLKISWSVGKGNWTEVPWLAILDTRVTDTTKHGVYFVYLFRGDMSGVYGTFLQGVTDIKKALGWRGAKKLFEERSEDVRRRFGEQLASHYTCDNDIDLRAKGKRLAPGYIASTIAHKLYEKDALPPAETLLDDLYALLDVYDAYAATYRPEDGEIPLPAEDDAAPIITDVPPVLASGPVTTADLHAAITARGYHFSPWLIAAFIHGLRTKPFSILAGISGTGKSKLPALVGELTGAHVELIPVRPDWTDSAELLGYLNLQGDFVPGRLLELARRAEAHPGRQHIAILDEMNLARVEQYFAEILSLVEDRYAVDGTYRSRTPLMPSAPEPWGGLHLPGNLSIVGTVNMDETTHGFSRKVLDRAFTLEMSDVDLSQWRAQSSGGVPVTETWAPQRWQAMALRPSDLSPDIETVELLEAVIARLMEINSILSAAQLQVGYRVRDEILLFLLHSQEDADAFTADSGPIDTLDLAVQMKILPRIQGGSGAIRSVLSDLLTWSVGEGTQETTSPDEHVAAWVQAGRPARHPAAKYPRTCARLCLMWARLQAEGFTSYWL